MSGYAILGWGSLIWDLDNLAQHIVGDWRMCLGPALPMEFTRISLKRKLGLVVCLDPEHGVPCPTHAISSVRTGIIDAMADLAARERAPLSRIGAVCLPSGYRQGRLTQVTEAVAAWCEADGLAGAVWTDLESNFAGHLGESFNIPRAIAYLRTLPGESLDEAVRYIHNAPAATDTPLRRALSVDPWWQGETRRLGLNEPVSGGRGVG